MLMVCCIAFTTQGLTVNAAIVSGGKKNYSYKELKTDLKQLQKKYRDHCQVNVIGKTADKSCDWKSKRKEASSCDWESSCKRTYDSAVMHETN